MVLLVEVMKTTTRDRICLAVIPCNAAVIFRDNIVNIMYNALWYTVVIGDCPKSFYYNLKSIIRFMRD